MVQDRLINNTGTMATGRYPGFFFHDWVTSWTATNFLQYLSGYFNVARLDITGEEGSF
jgi:hypothetical protein